MTINIKGRVIVKTEKNPRGAGRKRKLTPLEEVNVYQKYKMGVRPERIALDNNISASTVQRIIREHKNREGF